MCTHVSVRDSLAHSRSSLLFACLQAHASLSPLPLTRNWVWTRQTFKQHTHHNSNLILQLVLTPGGPRSIPGSPNLFLSCLQSERTRFLGFLLLCALRKHSQFSFLLPSQQTKIRTTRTYFLRRTKSVPNLSLLTLYL